MIKTEPSGLAPPASSPDTSAGSPARPQANALREEPVPQPLSVNQSPAALFGEFSIIDFSPSMTKEQGNTRRKQFEQAPLGYWLAASMLVLATISISVYALMFLEQDSKEHTRRGMELEQLENRKRELTKEKRAVANDLAKIQDSPDNEQDTNKVRELNAKIREIEVKLQDIVEQIERAKMAGDTRF